MSRKAIALAAFLFVSMAPIGAKADPILTPLLVAAGVQGSITIGASVVTYASLTSYGVKAPK